MTSGQVASIVCRPRVGGVGVDGGRHAVGGEHGDRALGDRVVELLDEHGAAGAQLLDHVLVVDDLLAHVDGRAVQLERALDGLHGAVDAGAVAARRGEEQLLREGGGHGARVYEAAPAAAAASARAELRISATVDSPTASRLRSGELVDRVAHRVGVAVGEVDEVDRRDRRRAGTACGRRGSSSASSAGRRRRRRRAPPRRASAATARRRSSCLARQPQALVGDVVEQHHLADLAAVGLHVRLRAAQRVGVGSPSSPGGSSSPSKSTKRISRAFARPALGPQVARDLDHRRRARRAVVGADEAGRVELRVVVRAEHDRGLAARAARRRCCAARDGRATASNRPPGSSGRSRSASARSCGEPAGRWPTATWRRMSANARSASKRLTRAAGTARERPGRPRRGRAVGRPPPPMSGKPLTASTTRPAPSASWTTARRRGRGPTARCACAQSFAVTASRMSAKRRRASSRRVGTCSVGTPSGGAS